MLFLRLVPSNFRLLLDNKPVHHHSYVKANTALLLQNAMTWASSFKEVTPACLGDPVKSMSFVESEVPTGLSKAGLAVSPLFT